jgi:hypothetical protein
MQNNENNFMFCCKIRAKLIFDDSGLSLFMIILKAAYCESTVNDIIHFGYVVIISRHIFKTEGNL